MNIYRSLVYCLLVTAGVVSGQTDTRPSWQARFVGTTRLRHAAFMEAYFSEDASLDYIDRWTLYISTFDPLGDLDEVYRVRAPGRHLDDPAGWTLEVMDASAYWPNNPDHLPSSVAGAEGVAWTSGFLVPGKQDGQIQLYDTTKDPLPAAVDITSLDSTTWAYHRVVWKDMDLDGDLDALTARFHLPLVGSTKMEFVWLENQGKGLVDGWPQHILAEDGPDVHFDLVTLTAADRTYDCVVVAEFFNQRTSIYWTESEDGSWTDSSLVRSRVINEEAGQVFDVLVDDFNRDGVQEFIATEYKTDLGVGQVTVYFFPEDFRTDPFTTTIIADNFVPHQIIGGQSMSPGTPKTYYPTAEFAESVAEDGLPHKPYILVSGDDDGRMYILFPASDARDDWTYEKNVLLDTEATTIGKMAHGDFDGDGNEEIVVAGYSSGQLYLFTYSPDASL